MFKVSDNPGGMKAWAPIEGPGAGVPRPDRNLGTLQWLSFLGLFGVDHFYLRSPITGIIKLLTFGGLFVWFIWDIVQVYSEKDRVLNYGLSLPFDMGIGIGQGMITDKPTAYTTQSSFSTWILTAFSSFLGTDSFATGLPAQGFRKIVDFAFLLLSLSSMSYDWTNGNYFRAIFAAIFVMFFGRAVVLPWLATVGSAISEPQEMFDKGIQLSEQTETQLNMFKAWTAWMPAPLRATVERDFGYRSIAGSELRAKFEIHHKGESKEQGATNNNNQNPAWATSFVLGSPLGLLYPAYTWVRAILNPTAAVAAAAGSAVGLDLSPSGIKKAAADAKQKLEALTAKTINPIPTIQNPIPTIQGGGALREEAVGLDGMILGATLIAILAGGAIKVVVDKTVA